MNAVVIIVALFAALAIVVLAAKGIRAKGVGLPYKRASYLFSPAERHFLAALDEALGTKYRIFGKVRVADLAVVKPGLDKGPRQGALNRIASKHFDFVICGATDLDVICVVELNDRSHSSAKAKRRDELVSRVCEAIGLPLLSVPARRDYDTKELAVSFQAALRPPVQHGA